MSSQTASQTSPLAVGTPIYLCRHGHVLKGTIDAHSGAPGFTRYTVNAFPTTYCIDVPRADVYADDELPHLIKRLQADREYLSETIAKLIDGEAL